MDIALLPAADYNFEDGKSRWFCFALGSKSWLCGQPNFRFFSLVSKLYFEREYTVFISSNITVDFLFFFCNIVILKLLLVASWIYKQSSYYVVGLW